MTNNTNSDSRQPCFSSRRMRERNTRGQQHATSGLSTKFLLYMFMFVWLLDWMSRLGLATTVDSSWFQQDYLSVELPLGVNRNPSELSLSSSSFQLASQQSFGFFDDIPENQWKIAQTIHAKAFPNHFREALHKPFLNEDIPSIKELASARWYAENFHEEFHCPYAQRLPTDASADGAKWVCDPHRIAKQKECLVYSVGSYGDTKFEQAIKQEIGEHCEIHSFDISSHNIRLGDFKDLLEKVGAQFHPWGLGTKQQAETYALSKQGPAYFTLQETMKMLNHSGRVVDIFKIDCEWCEWVTYHEWLSEGVNLRQILVETHYAPMPEAQNFFYSLHDAGYVIFSREPNLYMKGAGFEFAFLKLHTDFFIQNSMYSKLLSSPRR